jgi:hypothetical protein
MDISTDEEQYHCAECIVKGTDVLALNGLLEDDDTTQSSIITTIKEDQSFVFYRDRDGGDDYDGDSIHSTMDDDSTQYEDAVTELPYPIASQALEAAKDFWARGKRTIGVETLLHVTEGVCTFASKLAGISDLETDVLQPMVHAVDSSLTSAYIVVANAWNGGTTPTNEIMLPKMISFTDGFPDEDDDAWIPLDQGSMSPISVLESPVSPLSPKRLQYSHHVT